MHFEYNEGEHDDEGDDHAGPGSVANEGGGRKRDEEEPVGGLSLQPTISATDLTASECTYATEGPPAPAKTPLGATLLPSPIVQPPRSHLSRAEKRGLLCTIPLAALLSPLSTSVYLPELGAISDVR
jgi:hypothetical protein